MGKCDVLFSVKLIYVFFNCAIIFYVFVNVLISLHLNRALNSSMGILLNINIL